MLNKYYFALLLFFFSFCFAALKPDDALTQNVSKKDLQLRQKYGVVEIISSNSYPCVFPYGAKGFEKIYLKEWNIYLEFIKIDGNCQWYSNDFKAKSRTKLMQYKMNMKVIRNFIFIENIRINVAVIKGKNFDYTKIKSKNLKFNYFVALINSKNNNVIKKAFLTEEVNLSPLEDKEVNEIEVRGVKFNMDTKINANDVPNLQMLYGFDAKRTREINKK